MKRKTISLLLALALLFALAPQLTLTANAAASGKCGDNLTWSFDAGSGTLTISGYGEMYDFEDYDYLGYDYETDTYYVDHHYSTVPWYDYVDQIVALRLEEGLTYIGSYAFAGCSRLQNVTLPNSLTTIGWNAFRECSGLQSVSISDGVINIDSAAFCKCSSLQSVTIPRNVEYIDGYAFAGCTSLSAFTVAADNPYFCAVDGILLSKDKKTLVRYPVGKPGSTYTVPDYVTYIDSSAFEGCRGLQSISLPDSVTEIGDCAFYECSSLQNITIPNSVTEIGYNAFEGCSSLQSITIPDSVKEIGDSAFAECSGLQSVRIPEGITDLGQAMFIRCHSLRSVTIPSTVKNLGDSTFSECYSLETVTIPEGVTYIGNCAFYECSSLQYITIPDSIEEIGSDAFTNTAYYNNPNKWLNGLLYVGNWVVAAAPGITSANIRPGTVGIAGYAFNYWGNGLLTSVSIPEGLKYICGGAFLYCENLSSVNLPDSVKHIGAVAFHGTAYYDNPNKWLNGLLYLGHWLIGADENITIANIRAGTVGIAGCAMSTRENLTSVTLPDGLRYIDEAAFLYCEKLTNISIPHGVTAINEMVFDGCSSLTSITIPDSVTSIGSDAFCGCSSLKNLTIPDSVTSIGQYAFDGCSSLTNLTIPNNVTSIGKYAFSGCSSLKNLTIPNSVTSIGKGAFEGCSSLTNLTISDGVKTIDEWAFAGCGNLKAIIVPDSVTSIGNEAFAWSGYNQKSILILNKDCDIDDSEYTLNFPEFTTVFGYPGSTAEAYARKWGYTFKSIEDVSFIDVADDVYYTEPVVWAVEREVTNGTAPYLFSPENTCTRAQVVTFLWRAAGSPEPTSGANPFVDVKSDAYYYKAVLWAVENGITTGTSADKFSPNSACTRAQVVTFLWRAEGKPAPVSTANPFKDVNPSEYYGQAVLWAVENGVTTGSSADRFSPASTCTRAQIVTFLYRDMAEDN